MESIVQTQSLMPSIELLYHRGFIEENELNKEDQ